MQHITCFSAVGRSFEARQAHRQGHTHTSAASHDDELDVLFCSVRQYCENVGPYPHYDPHSIYRYGWWYSYLVSHPRTGLVVVTGAGRLSSKVELCLPE